MNDLERELLFRWNLPSHIFSWANVVWYMFNYLTNECLLERFRSRIAQLIFRTVYNIHWKKMPCAVIEKLKIIMLTCIKSNIAIWWSEFWNSLLDSHPWRTNSRCGPLLTKKDVGSTSVRSRKSYYCSYNPFHGWSRHISRFLPYFIYCEEVHVTSHVSFLYLLQLVLRRTPLHQRVWYSLLLVIIISKSTACWKVAWAFNDR